MNKPRIGQVFNDVAKYWDDIEKMRTDKGLPSWAFDFISVHAPLNAGQIIKHMGDEKHIYMYGYSFVSPLCLVDAKTGMRPEWEEDNYCNKKHAISAARKLAKIHNLHVVVVA